jgi:putative phage-type endonuclease
MHDRSKFIGSSDIAGILGVSNYNTPLDIYQRKVNPQTESESSLNRNLIRGKILEPLLISYLEIDQNIQISERNKRVFHKKIPYLTAEIDAHSTTGIQIEIKTSEVFMQNQWGDDIDSIPIEYLSQCYWAMGLNKQKQCLLAVLIGLNKVKYYTINQNLSVYKGMLRQAVKFWNEFVLPKIPPEPKNLQDLSLLFPSSEGEIEATNDIYNEICELKAIKSKIKDLTDQQKNIEFDIKSYLKNKEVLTFDNKKIATFTLQNKNEYVVKASSTKVLRIK